MELGRRDFVAMLPAGLAAAFFGWLGWRAVVFRYLKAEPATQPAWQEGPRVHVATREELATGNLARPWGFKYFEYPIPGDRLKGVLLRLPRPVAGGLSAGGVHLLALVRRCTHQGCTVNYVRDPETAALAYNVRFETPVLACPCHFGVFDPLRAGKAVYGPPRLPLARLRLEEAGDTLYATGYEPAAAALR